MYHEIHRLHREGRSISSISDLLVMNWRTVKKYLCMNEFEYEAFLETQSKRQKELGSYEHFVKVKLEQYPDTSASQMHDWLKEHYEDFPDVNPKTVFNFVTWVRQKHHIPKTKIERDYFIVEELPYGKQAQVDFGEYNIRTGSGKRKKVYFFAIVLSRSRYKYVYFSDMPFTSDTAVKAHEKAFEYFKGIPKEVVYDQDSVFINDENKGDLILTHKFRNYVKQRGFDIYFCRKADPESKGKIENVVKYVKQNFLYNRPYYDLDTLNREALAWLGRTANNLPHGKTKLSPEKQWQIEQKHLSEYTPADLPEAEKNIYTLRKDNVVSYKSNLYSVPQGTWKSDRNKVLLQEKGELIIISLPDGKELCRHKICSEKGKTIINTNHRRDVSIKIIELINSDAKRFNSPDKAKVYFEQLKKHKGRYIRDQLSVIRSCFELFSNRIMDKTMDYCLENDIFSASDFKATAEKINARLKQSSSETTPEIKTLSETNNTAAQVQPEISQLTDYESIMLN